MGVYNDRLIKHAEFYKIQSLSRTFTLDAFSNSSGSNALCKDFLSPDKSYFQADLAGHHLWINAPFPLLHDTLHRYREEKNKNPHTTSACFLVPKWPSSWRPLLTGMRKLLEYPIGYPLFELPPDQRRGLSPLRGIPWPVEIYYDPPLPRAQMKATSSSGCSMLFQGLANRIPVLVAADTQASESFINKDFVLQHNISCTPSSQQVELANGSCVSASGQCRIYLRIPGQKPGTSFARQIQCTVLDLGADFDIILGEDWLQQTQADLSYRTGTCTVHTLQGPVTLVPLTHTSRPFRRFPLLSALDIRRYVKSRRSAASIFMVHVTDSAVSFGGGESIPSSDEDPPHPLDPAEDIVFPETISPGLRQVLDKRKIVFSKFTGKLVDRGIDHVIPTVPGTKPAYRPPYRLSPAEQKEVEKQISDLLLMGLIEPSTSPYGAPVLFVAKPDGSLRMCIDYRLLNSQTIKQRGPLPRIDQLLDQLHGAKVLSSLDMTQAYYQIKLAPEDVHKTAFITPFGQYQFKVVSFGLCNAPSTFQSLMNKIFRPLLGRGVAIYLDDILIYARSQEEHAVLMDKVLQILEENEFRLSLKKCFFEKSELKYLGHIVGCQGIKVDPAKTEAVRNWPVPTNVSQVRSFLGLANYFRKFILAYSNMVIPLTQLTRKEVIWNSTTWTPACQQAFDEVKQALTEAPTLTLPDFEKPDGFELICDASNQGIGAVLIQRGQPIAFESKKLSDAENRWTVGDQELWAVIHALKVFRCYLEGIDFLIVSDHHPLVHLQTQPNLSRRQARWAEYLQRFTYQWEYRPGRTNVADPLSRRPFLASIKACQAKLCKIGQVPPPSKAEGRRHRRPNVRLQPLAENPKDFLLTKRKATRQLSNLPTPRRRGSKMDDLPPPPVVLSRQAIPAALTSPDQDIFTGITAAYKSDPWFSEAVNTSLLSFRDGVWYRGSQIVVPDVEWIRKGILYELHDAPYSGHVGTRKTIAAVTERFWWPGLRRYIRSYIAACEACQRNKTSTQKPPGLLQPLPIPNIPWDSVSMDFITGLPVTPREHDAILVVVDRLTKMTHIIPTTTTVDAMGTARLFVDNVWKHHGVPLSVVSDRGSVFVGTFFTELLKILGTQHKRSSAFHPQTDGQTERVNKVLEDMLRHYVMGLDEQKNWDLYLSAAEFAINNSFHESIGTTPFRLNTGRDPRLPLSLTGSSRVPSAASFADRIEKGLASAKKCLQAAQQRQKKYADQKRRDVTFNIGAQVLLSTTNLRLRKAFDNSLTDKLLPKWVGPFTILEKLGQVAYKLKLPDPWRVHPVFHVSLLKPYQTDGRVQPPVPLLVDGEVYYLIDQILDHRSTKQGRKSITEYYIRWKGYGPEHNTWEPQSNIAESENGATLQKYWDTLGLEPPLS